MKPFEAPDFFRIDDLLTSEEKEIRNTVRTFVNKEVLPIIADYFQQGNFPSQLISLMGEMGLLGATLSGYDCAGLNPLAYGLIMQELERGDSGIRSFVSVQGALCMYPIWRYGTDKQKQWYLPKMAKGELIGCFGLTEPDFGSNPGGMRTTARKDGSHYILNGNKMWITNGSISHLAIIWAKNENNEVVGFIVDRSLSGFQVRDIDKKFSLRASVTSEIILEDCRVPVDHQLQVVGLKGPFSCLNEARYGIAWGAIGAASACYHEAVEYSKTRIQFDKPIASYQLVQAKLANMLNEITKAQLLVYRLGRLKDAGQATHQQISLAKMNNVSMALQVARTCRDILGANGITLEYQTGRHLLNLESVNTYEGTEDIHRLIVGSAITGIEAFR
ncbi:MAG: acyl-CoA dehydrogenase family protein [Pseudobdellovibrionaceae bacterium]|nr:acyl-CoA dehydrogenase family protein [Pseudobdellovibrionaceae bacterium]